MERKETKKSLTSHPWSLFPRCGFTLVELIVVIAILAILGTVAFTSLSGFQSSARDSDRITTLKNIDSGLSLFHIRSGLYPMPDPNGSWTVLTGSINGTVYAYLGTIGDSASRIVRMSRVPLDPVSGQSYVYGVSADRKYYQTAAVLESTEAFSPHQIPLVQNASPLTPLSPRWISDPKGEGSNGFSFIPTAYAASSYQARVNGDYPGYFKFSSGAEVWIANVPSLLWNNTGSVSLLSTGTYFVVNRQANLPYRLDPASIIQNQDGDRIVQAITGTGTATLTGVNITNVATAAGVSYIFTEALLASFGGNMASIQSAVLGTGTASGSVSDCTLSGTVVPHGQHVTAYSENDIVWNAAYDCTARQQTRTCDNGTLDGSGSYQYSSCVKGTPNNCSASGSFVYNSHTYSIPSLNHSSGATNILSANVSENNGVFRYTLDSITCNDGSYASVNEGASPTVQSCNAGYGVNGNGCSASQNGSCNNTVALGCNTGTAINDNTATACGTTRIWNCSGLYGGNTSVQCSYNNGACRWEQQYTTPGSYTWTVPAGVTSVSVVCVGWGGGGGWITFWGGGGWALAYANNISITPGQSIAVIVGAGGQPSAGIDDGGVSSFSSSCIANGGKGVTNGRTGGTVGAWVGGDGWAGGAGHGGEIYGGGGGWAGGYSGNGGSGGRSFPSGWGPDSGTNGAGGAGGGWGTYGNGGGVGILGQGSSGTGGDNSMTGTPSKGTAGSGGSGITYWGGGQGNGTVGGNGACRIVWPGNTRQFPSTDVGP